MISHGIAHLLLKALDLSKLSHNTINLLQFYLPKTMRVCFNAVVQWKRNLVVPLKQNRERLIVQLLAMHIRVGRRSGGGRARHTWRWQDKCAPVFQFIPSSYIFTTTLKCAAEYDYIARGQTQIFKSAPVGKVIFCGRELGSLHMNGKHGWQRMDGADGACLVLICIPL